MVIQDGSVDLRPGVKPGHGALTHRWAVRLQEVSRVWLDWFLPGMVLPEQLNSSIAFFLKAVFTVSPQCRRRLPFPRLGAGEGVVVFAGFTLW